MGATCAFVGRLMLASLFLLSGAMKLAQHDEAGGPIVAYAQPKLDAALGRLHALTGVQLPLDQAAYPLLVMAAGCVELLGGVLFTFNQPLGAALLAAFLVPTSLVMHAFWELPEGSPGYQIEFINFAKNVCLLGAFIMYMNMPRWPLLVAPAKLKGL